MFYREEKVYLLCKNVEFNKSIFFYQNFLRAIIFM